MSRVQPSKPSFGYQRVRRIVCFFLGGVPGAIWTDYAVMAILAGSLPFRDDVTISTSTTGVEAFTVVLVVWGILGIVGYASGMVVIVALPHLNYAWRRRLTAGVWLGLVAILPAALVSFVFSLTALLSAIGMIISCVLLLRMLRD